MKANNASPSHEEKRCLLCNNLFRPHPKAKNRQRVCQRDECQQLRQKLNHRDWLKRNPVDYKTWNQDYGQAWRQTHPNYWRQYRQQKRSKKRHAHPLILEAQLTLYQAAKKEQLSTAKSAGNSPKRGAKKEQLTQSFYLLKANALALWPLAAVKKEQLGYGFNCN